MSPEQFIRGLPKTELHMHLEGSMEPETIFELAERNGITLRWSSPEQMQAAYEFEGLAPFLDLYFEACSVLRTRRDFTDAARAYFRRAKEDGVVHAEMFFGPQTFLDNGTPVAEMMEGVLDALDEVSGPDFSAGLLVSVHRHRTEDQAFDVLRAVEPWLPQISGIGMGGVELGNPPSKFARFFKACQAAGIPTMVHAGEEAPSAYVREAIDLLPVVRIDHGVAAAQDPELLAVLAERGIPLTVCPLSNLRLKVVATLADHPLPTLLRAGVKVTVNSDDPPYFGGWVTENLLACHEQMGLSGTDIIQIVRNGLEAALVTAPVRSVMLDRLDAYVATHGATIKALQA